MLDVCSRLRGCVSMTDNHLQSDTYPWPVVSAVRCRLDTWAQSEQSEQCRGPHRRMGRRCPLVPPRAAAAHFSAAAWRAAAARHGAPLHGLLCTGRIVSLQAGGIKSVNKDHIKNRGKSGSLCQFLLLRRGPAQMLMWLLMAVLSPYNHRHFTADG